MNIAIDIDDTLTESFDYFQPFVAEYFGADVEEVRRRNISYGNLPPEWKDRELDFCRAYYDRVVVDTTFKSDARWGVEKLRGMGHRIVIITARTPDFYTDPYLTTRQELAKGGISYDNLICTLDKGTACAQEGINLLVDDSPANCAAAAERGVPAILFTSKANRDLDVPFPRVSDWVEAVDMIAKILGKN